jgi:hypothetical protein
MNTFKFSEFGNDYTCRYYFDADTSTSGVEVSNGDNHVGSIVGLEIPDEDDEDFKELAKDFTNEVIGWLVENEN